MDFSVKSGDKRFGRHSEALVSEPFAGLLEGLAGGFQTGHEFREDIKSRRRRRELEDRLAFLREQQEQRASAEESRQATTYGQQQEEYTRRKGLRTEVTAHLAQPTRFKTLGQYVSGQPGEHGGPPLSAEAQRAQAVGRVLGEFGGRELNPDEQLLVGSGEVPASAIQPRRYYPTTRDEYLQNARDVAGYRRPGQRTGMTRAQAAAAVAKIDLDYSQRNRFGGGVKTHYLSPAQRLEIIDKMVDGTFTEADLPDPGGSPSTAPAPSLYPFSGGGRPREQGLTDFLQGAPRPGSTSAPGRPKPTSAAPGLNGILDHYVDRTTTRAGGRMDMGEVDVDPARVQAALAMLDDFPDLSIDDWEASLRDDGYTDAEISAVLRSANP